MTITSAFASAASGLAASSRAAGVISDNIANATTEGFRTRELLLSAQAPAGGVRVDGVRRAADTPVTGDRRLADAALAGARVTADFLASTEAAVGTPGSPGALTDALAGFEAALTGAANRPEDHASLLAAVDAGKAVARRVNDLSLGVTALRAEADARITAAVAALDAGLTEVERLNGAILRTQATGGDANGLRDARDRAIDALAPIVPLRVVARADGQVALFAGNGALLLDGHRVTPGVSAAPEGPVSLTLDGRPVAASGPGAALAGGELAALVDLRDSRAPTLLGALDALAADLVARFAGPAVDPTLAAGAPGLFTDAAGAGAAQPGLAARLDVTARADPARGGQASALRDGLNATAPRPAGDGSLLFAALDALARPRAVAAPGLPEAAGSASVLAAGLLSGVSMARLAAETAVSDRAAERTGFATQEAAQGVNTDAQLQQLLLVERSFAANARVIQALDEMLRQLERL